VGTLLNGALELSNTDVATSFVNLLTASTAFSANSRVIATTQELFQTLLSLPRS
jgi:flagellar hook protein FlgE